MVYLRDLSLDVAPLYTHCKSKHQTTSNGQHKQGKQQTAESREERGERREQTV
jgi:hypothetical protein